MVSELAIASRVPQVRSYAHVPDVLEVPNLVQVQLDSYDWFRGQGLAELLRDISPIEDFTGTRFELTFLNPNKGPEYGQSRYASPLFVTVWLKHREAPQEYKESVIFLGDFPLMTRQGTFIVNGAERVVVSQLVRSPGVYLTLERDATSGRDLCYAKLIPNRGAWLEVETSNKNVISVKVDRKRKIAITTLLRAIDEPELLPRHSSAATIREIQGRIDNAKTEREADKLRHELLHTLGSNERILALFEAVEHHAPTP